VLIIQQMLLSVFSLRLKEVAPYPPAVSLNHALESQRAFLTNYSYPNKHHAQKTSQKAYTYAQSSFDPIF
ncbi:glycine dehydrogenase, partial [Listeria innocua FSL S4-378]